MKVKEEHINATFCRLALKRLNKNASDLFNDNILRFWFPLNRTAITYLQAFRVVYGDVKFEKLSSEHKSMVATVDMIGLTREV